MLERFGIQIKGDDIGISRVDFCVDILTPDFILIPDQFIMHSSTGRRDHLAETDKHVNGKSGRTTSVTIGAPRNRQVIIYDKRAEVIARSKPYWWTIWNDTLSRQSLPEISPTLPENSRVWRVEFRAGKDLLKDRWGIRTWAQLYARFGDLCRESGEVVRYTEPNRDDPNRARWPTHPLWEIVCGEMNDDLIEMRSGSDPNPMKEVHKEQHIALILRNVLGCNITLAALNEVTFEDLQGFFKKTGQDLCDLALKSPQKTQKALKSAQDRYVFMGDNGRKGEE